MLVRFTTKKFFKQIVEDDDDSVLSGVGRPGYGGRHLVMSTQNLSELGAPCVLARGTAEGHTP